MAQVKQTALRAVSSNTHAPSTDDDADLQRARSHTFPTISITSGKKMRVDAAKEKHTVRVLLVGESHTGKTSLIKKFISDEFNARYHRTVGLDVNQRNCDVPIEILEEFDDDDGWVPSMPSFDELGASAGLGGGLGGGLTSSLTVDGGLTSSSTHHSYTSSGGSSSSTHVKKTTAVVNVRLKIVDAGVYALGQDNSEKDLSGISAVICVVDLCNLETMEALPRWVRFIAEQVVDRRRKVKLHARENSADGGDGAKKHFKDELVVVIAANKYDSDSRQITMSQLETFCEERVYPELRELNGSSMGTTIRIGGGANSLTKPKQGGTKINTDFLVVPVSAKSGYNVEHIFESVLQRILPARLEASSHNRTRTTAQIRAPIWLRQLALGFGDEDGPPPSYASSDEDDEFSEHGDELEDDGMMLAH